MNKILLPFLILLCSLTSYSQCSDLFFSEYIEGTSFNKAVEIYNPSGSPIDLSDYMIRVYYNGNVTPSTLTLSGILNPGEVFIAAHPSASPTILALADVTNSGVLNFNGNDAVELYKISSNTVLDIIGIVGNNPGTEWLLNGVSGTVDKTLVRKNTVKTGTNIWTGIGEMQWDIHPVNTFSFLNTHAMKPCLYISANPTIACVNATVHFVAAISGGQTPYTVNWSFGDSGTGTSNPTTHVYTSSGTYTVVVVVTDALGEFETQSLPVIINENPIVNITTNPDPANGCEPLMVCFTANISNGQPPYTGMWNFDDGNTSTTLINTCNTYPAGTYNPSVTVVDMNGCQASASTAVNVFANDDASFNYSLSSYCINDVNPVPAITGTPGGTFTCNTCVINPSTGEINLSLSGTGTHIITYTTPGFCSASSQVNVTIYSLANTTIYPAGPFCEMGVPAQLIAATPGGVWSGNGIIDANLGIFDASVAGVGTHTITYTIGGACGNSSTLNIDVLANAAVNIHTPDTGICNNFFGFFLNADAGGFWSGSNVSDMNNGQGFFNASSIAGGIYYAVYTIPGLCGDVDSIQINVSEFPVPSFTYTVAGNTITFTNTSTTYGSTSTPSYQWTYSSDGGSTWNSFSNQTNPTYTGANGSYMFCLEASTGIACGIQTLCTTIVVNKIIELNYNALNIYPNPTNGILHIENNHMQNFICKIYDPAGREIYLFNTIDKKLQLDISKLPDGIYYLLFTSDKESGVLKFILQK